MPFQPSPVVIMILGLFSSALLAGMIVLTLSAGPKRLLNRRFAVLLMIYLLGNTMAIIVWSYAALGAVIPNIVLMILTKLLGVSILLGAYVGFLFTETLVGEQPWSKRLRTIIGIVVFVLVIIVLLPEDIVATANNNLVNIGAAIYAAVCAA